ncbi:ash family protein [Escherichia coli]|nr:ash family protein [Escherichia coli]EEZ2002713.1 ash family protein [Escherichia coli]EFB3017595.1 ash family protein [Escherichia coli]EFE8777561.1 ash family protein [Escherichia coli]EFH6809503.1 ash family protein [Escherichia coli]
MVIQKNRLPAFVWSGYISRAPHKTGVGISTPPITKAHNRASGFFVRTVSPRLFRTRIMVGRTGPTSVGPGSLVTGCGNPVRLATPSFPPLDGEFSKFTTKEATPWQTVNNSASALSAVTSRPKSTADCTGLSPSPELCTSICFVSRDAGLHLITLPPRSVTWQTICGICSAWLTNRGITRKALFPEILKRHSVIWRGVLLPVIREDI